MSKKIDFELKESFLELKILCKKVKTNRLKKRLLFLILKDGQKYKTRECLADYLNASELLFEFGLKLI